MSDDVVEIGGRRILIPGGLDSAPHGRHGLTALGPEDDVAFMVFVTDEPTPEGIASGGQDGVAAFTMRLTIDEFRKYVADCNAQLARIDSG